MFHDVCVDDAAEGGRARAVLHRASIVEMAVRRKKQMPEELKRTRPHGNAPAASAACCIHSPLRCERRASIRAAPCPCPCPVNLVRSVSAQVPYGDPRTPANRKCALDAGDYGLGFAANSLGLGCDCLGAVRYFDAVLNDSKGEPVVIKNAVCMHEEDAGLLWKHVDYRCGGFFVDASVGISSAGASPPAPVLLGLPVCGSASCGLASPRSERLFRCSCRHRVGRTGYSESRRARRLVVSFIMTAVNYEYCFYWVRR